MVILSAAYVCASQRQQRPKMVSDHVGPGILEDCEQLCGCWGLNLGHLEEQSVFLTSEKHLLLQDDVIFK